MGREGLGELYDSDLFEEGPRAWINSGGTQGGPSRVKARVFAWDSLFGGTPRFFRINVKGLEFTGNHFEV